MTLLVAIGENYLQIVIRSYAISKVVGIVLVG